MRGASPRGCRLSRSTLTGGCSRRRIGAAQQPPHRGVRRHHAPVPVHRQRRVGLVPLEHQVDGLARGCQRGVLQRPLAEHRREARRHQQRVALAQRHLQPLGQMQDHVAAGLRRGPAPRSSGAWWRCRPPAPGRAGTGAGAGATRAAIRRRAGSMRPSSWATLAPPGAVEQLPAG